MLNVGRLTPLDAHAMSLAGEDDRGIGGIVRLEDLVGQRRAAAVENENVQPHVSALLQNVVQK
jgi:hypothetical protein